MTHELIRLLEMVFFEVLLIKIKTAKNFLFNSKLKLQFF